MMFAHFSQHVLLKNKVAKQKVQGKGQELTISGNGILTLTWSSRTFLLSLGVLSSVQSYALLIHYFWQLITPFICVFNLFPLSSGLRKGGA